MKVGHKEQVTINPKFEWQTKKKSLSFVLCHHSPLAACNATLSKVATEIMINITIDFYLKFKRSNALIRGGKNINEKKANGAWRKI